MVQATWYGIVSQQSGVTPPFVDTLPITANLLAHYNANDTASITDSGGSVSAWNDLSGNDYHLAQATSAAQPTTGTQTIGGRNAVYFDPTSDIQYMDSSAINNTGDVTMYVVYQADAGQTAGASILATASSSTTDSFELTYRTNSTVQLSTLINSTGLEYFGDDDTDVHIIAITWKHYGAMMYKDSQNYGSRLPNPNAVGTNVDVDIVRLGLDRVLNTTGFKGKIGQVVVYTGIHTGAQIDTMGSFFATKWSGSWTSRNWSESAVTDIGTPIVWSDFTDMTTVTSGSSVNRFETVTDKSGNGNTLTSHSTYTLPIGISKSQWICAHSNEANNGMKFPNDMMRLKGTNLTFIMINGDTSVTNLNTHLSFEYSGGDDIRFIQNNNSFGSGGASMVYDDGSFVAGAGDLRTNKDFAIGNGTTSLPLSVDVVEYTDDATITTTYGGSEQCNGPNTITEITKSEQENSLFFRIVSSSQNSTKNTWAEIIVFGAVLTNTQLNNVMNNYIKPRHGLPWYDINYLANDSSLYAAYESRATQTIVVDGSYNMTTWGDLTSNGFDLTNSTATNCFIMNGGQGSLNGFYLANGESNDRRYMYNSDYNIQDEVTLYITGKHGSATFLAFDGLVSTNFDSIQSDGDFAIAGSASSTISFVYITAGPSTNSIDSGVGISTSTKEVYVLHLKSASSTETRVRLYALSNDGDPIIDEVVEWKPNITYMQYNRRFAASYARFAFANIMVADSAETQTKARERVQYLNDIYGVNVNDIVID